MMNIEYLKVFYHVVNNNSFTQTGLKLHISQSSVSLKIKHLEEDLNVKLFDRTTKKLVLTEAGKLVYDYAEKIFETINQLNRELTSISTGISGDMAIGASMTIGEQILPYQIGLFKQKYPRINIQMEIQNSSEIQKKVLDKELDIGFIESPNYSKELEAALITEDELVIVGPSNYSTRFNLTRETISASQLFSLPIIFRELGSGTRQVIEETLLNNKVDPSKLNIILEFEHTESIKSAVESGIGISIISHSAVWKELQLGTLKRLNIEGINLKRWFYAIYRKNKELPIQAETFLDFIVRK